MQNYITQQQINAIFSLAIQAGEIAKSAFNLHDFEVFIKNDKSQLSSIDLEISQLIHKNLSQLFPQIPIICEEGQLRNFAGDEFFLIDPIDGTSSFVNNSPEFCINICLIKNNKPLFGMIYAPMFEGGKMMINNTNGEVVIYNHGTTSKTILNEIKTFASGLKIITSLRTKDQDIINYVGQFYPQFSKNFTVEKLSSAIKFFRIIEGKANLYLHVRQSMEWDTASGHALINSLGHRLLSFNYDNKIFNLGDELQYKKNNFINSGFVIMVE